MGLDPFDEAGYIIGYEGESSFDAVPRMTLSELFHVRKMYSGRVDYYDYDPFSKVAVETTRISGTDLDNRIKRIERGMKSYGFTPW